MKGRKPLSCFYCESALLFPGRNGSAFESPIHPYTECISFDVVEGLYELFEKKAISKTLSGGRPLEHFRDFENWSPYVCGHFQASMIKASCANELCGRSVIVHEWLYVAIKTGCVTMFDAPVCSIDCADALAEKYQDGSNHGR